MAADDKKYDLNTEEGQYNYVVDTIRKGMREACGQKRTKESIQAARTSMLMQHDDATAACIKAVEDAGAKIRSIEMGVSFWYDTVKGVWSISSIGAPYFHFDEPPRLNPPGILKFDVDPSFWEGKHEKDNDDA